MRNLKRTQLGLIVAVLGLLMAFQNCGGSNGFDAAGSGGFPSAKLQGQTYELVGLVKTASCADVDVPADQVCAQVFEEEAPTHYHEITFGADTFDTRLACNSGDGAYVVSGETLTIGSFRQTLRACDGLEEEELVAHRLTHAARIVVQADEIVIYTNQASALRFRRIQ